VAESTHKRKRSTWRSKLLESGTPPTRTLRQPPDALGGRASALRRGARRAAATGYLTKRSICWVVIDDEYDDATGRADTGAGMSDNEGDSEHGTRTTPNGLKLDMAAGQPSIGRLARPSRQRRSSAV
jgi:hypothetical protein